MDCRVNVFLDRQQAKFVAQEAARIGRPQTEVLRRALDCFRRHAFARQCAEDSANRGLSHGQK
jgi:hypothetical protein